MAERRVRVSRSVRIDESLLASALLRLRRDQGAPFARWTLGDHGSVEIDTWFTLAEDGAHRAAGWLFGPEGDVVRVDIVATARGDRSDLTLRTRSPLPSRRAKHPSCLQSLARVALTEIGEELRWQASRTVPATA